MAEGLLPGGYDGLKPMYSRFRSCIGVFVLAALSALSGNAQQPTEADLNRMVKLVGIEVKGSRLPSESIVALSALKMGSEVNNAIVNKACARIQGTGLFKSVDYLYNLYPDRPEVTLTLTVVDETPLLPASIKPASDDAELWPALQALDPMFTRDLPPTEKALRFYALNLEGRLKKKGRTDEYVAPSVRGDSAGNPVAIVFEVKKYKALANPN